MDPYVLDLFSILYCCLYPQTNYVTCYKSCQELSNMLKNCVAFLKEYSSKFKLSYELVQPKSSQVFSKNIHIKNSIIVCKILYTILVYCVATHTLIVRS